MKILIAVFGALIVVAGSVLAQTYINVPLTPTSPSNSIVVPTNTVFHLLHVRTTDQPQSGVQLSVDYPNLPTMATIQNAQMETPSYAYSLPVLGPATVNLQGFFFETNSAVMCLVMLEAVNATPDIRGFAVQPAKNSATITLETSTNLANWLPATNGTYSATNSARFFRMNFSVQP